MPCTQRAYIPCTYVCINPHNRVLRIRIYTAIDTAHTRSCIRTYMATPYVRVKPLYRGNALNRSSTLANPFARASTLHFVHFRSSTLSPFSYSCPLASFNATPVAVAASPLCHPYPPSSDSPRPLILPLTA